MAEQKNSTWQAVEYASVWEAEDAVDFPVLVPSIFGTESIQKILVICDEIVQILYPNNIVYRTAKGTADISGVYTSYEPLGDFIVDRYTVSPKGAYNRVFLATWNDGNYTYSLHVPFGISRENLEKCVTSLSQVNSLKTMPNPIVEYDYIFEAEYAVGFGVAIPAVFGTGKIEKICVIDNWLVEIFYPNGIVYRTAKGDGDISGIYESYPCTKIFDELGFHVTAKGNESLYYLVTWTGYGMAWSLYCPHGIPQKAVSEVLRSLRAVDGGSIQKEGVTSKDIQKEETASDGIHGAYGKYHLVTPREREVFYKALGHLVGVDYEPLLVAVQIVGGTNYRFICNAEAVVLTPIPYLAQVTVFEPLPSGKLKHPVITDIKKLS